MGRVNAPRPRIVLSANTAWFITNFCAGLVRNLRRAGFDPVVIAPEDPAVEEALRELGAEHIKVRIERAGINPLADLRLFADYRRLFAQIRPAAYLGFTIKPNIYGSLAAASLGIPAFPNVSGIGNAFIRRDLVQQVVTHLSRLAFRRAPAVFFQNRDDCRLFLDRRIVRPEQVHVLPGCGVDLERFAPAPPVKEPLTFLLIARLVRDKGIAEFIEAARALKPLFPKARFQLLGGPDEGHRTAISLDELQAWIAEGTIDYLGTTDDVRPFIAAASAIVLPSYREGLPSSLLEAGAMARPVIATDVAGCRQVIEDRVNGFFCAPRDSASLADAMHRFAELEFAQRVVMGEAARRRVQKRFSEELVVRAYLEAIGRLDAPRTVA